MSSRRWCLILGAALSVSASATATTHVVKPDGTGDAPTIEDAVGVAADGDTVVLEDGVFHGRGNRDITCGGKTLEIRSASDDPAACIIDCEGSETAHHWGFMFHALPAPGTTLRGVTVQNAWYDFGGGGIRCMGPVDFSNCILRDNHNVSGSSGGGWGGGGVVCQSSASFVDCVFEDNHASGGGAFAGCGAGGDFVVSFERCTFVRNTASDGGGACWVDRGMAVHFEECLFLENQASGGAALYCESDGQVILEGCTMAGNAASLGGSCLFAYDGGTAVMNRCILAFSEGGSAVWGETSTTAQLTCCDIYGNAGGDWVNGIEEQAGVNGNLCLNPLFCEDDYGLHANSPCRPDYNPDCGLIGTLPVACEATPTLRTSWGGVKLRFHGSAK